MLAAEQSACEICRGIAAWQACGKSGGSVASEAAACAQLVAESAWQQAAFPSLI